MPKIQFYYGWVILLALAITEMLALGVTSYAAGLFVLPLQNEFGLSRAAANSPFSIILVGVTFLTPIVGKCLDRYSVKWVLSVGALALSLAFIVIATTSSFLLMVLMLAVPAAIGFIAVGTLTTGTLLSRWFYKRRGLALGLGAVATSGGGIFVVPILAGLIADYGWRTTLLLEAAAISLISILLAIFVLHNTPTDMGLESHPENDGRPHHELNKTGAPPFMQWPWHKILSSRDFWGASITLAIISGISQALVTTLPPYTIQLGFSNAMAARLILFFAIAAGATKIIGGLLADYINRRIILFCAGIIMMAAALLLLTSMSYAALAGATILAGIALGCTLPASAAQIAATFGSTLFGTVMGWGYMLLGVAVIVLVPLTGAIFDKSGSYEIAFVLFAILSFTAAISTWLIPQRQR